MYVSNKRYQLIFTTSEVSPWSKTGGLGEVLGGLPEALARRGHRVMCISPRWDQYSDAWDTNITLKIKLNGKEEFLRYFHTFKNNVDYVFVDHPLFLECINGLTGMRYYGPEMGVDWPNNQEKFALFAHAALEAVLNLPLNKYPYGEESAIICNDWHTSLIPCLVVKRRIKEGVFMNTKVFLCIHNIVFQGRFLYENQEELYNIDKDLLEKYICMQTVSIGSKEPEVKIVNWLKGAIFYSDQVLTVSKTFAKEIIESVSRGIQLDSDLRNKGSVIGILNGLKDSISPKNENLCKSSNIPIDFISDVNINKKICKMRFQELMNFKVDSEMPIFLFIGRLDFQKGCDVFFEAIRHIFGIKNYDLQNDISSLRNTQIVIIGSGIQKFTKQVQELQFLFPNQIKSESFIKGSLKYLALSSADFLVAPSRFEPCGLVQIEAMRFGCIPICTPTGGFIDTVKHLETGILLNNTIELESTVTRDSVESVIQGIDLAYSLYKYNQLKLHLMRKNALDESHKLSLNLTACNYEIIFENSNLCDISHFQSRDKALKCVNFIEDIVE